MLGIIGRSPSAKSLASRSLAFKISVLYHYFNEEKGKILSRFPPAARRMDTLNDLLAASDLISLHCALTNDTIQILSAEALQHVKPGAFLVNTGSSQLLDDCAVKQLLIDGTLAVTIALIHEQHCLKFLDSKKPRSVIYSCFGSSSQVTPPQLIELGFR